MNFVKYVIFRFFWKKKQLEKNNRQFSYHTCENKNIFFLPKNVKNGSKDYLKVTTSVV